MSRNLQKRLREVMRDEANEDGMTVNDLCQAVGHSYTSVRQCLHRMPDAYIDRWIFRENDMGEKVGMPAAVWCVVKVPDHCPRPKARQPSGAAA